MTIPLPAAVRAALLPLARAGRTVTYRDLTGLVPVPPPHGIHKLTEALEDLVREDHAAGRPLIAALAVSRVGESVPTFQALTDLHLAALLGHPGAGGPRSTSTWLRLLAQMGRELRATTGWSRWLAVMNPFSFHRSR